MIVRSTRFCKCWLAVVLAIGGTATSQAEQKFTLIDQDVVLFAGGANMVRLQQAGYLEAILTKAFPAARPRFRDFAWEADTVFGQGSVIERWRTDGFGDRDQQLQRTGATVVIAQYGRLESLSGAARLAEFVGAYEELIDAFSKQARLIVLVTPTPFETAPSTLIPDLSKRNADLALYVEAIAKIAESRDLVLVDLFTNAGQGLTDNGMHITAESQSRIAAEITRKLGVQVPADSDLETLRIAVIEKHRLWFDYWRPANWKLLYGDDSERGFTRGGKDYIPFREEWKKLLPLIQRAEERVWQIASGDDDPGPSRPEPEVLHGAPNADIEMELKAFRTTDGLQVNLFASENEGLTSPLHLRWDPAGRMYVTVTTTYPHVFPGDLPNDKIIVLEDTDNDGRADKSTVFAEGLNIPTGIELGEGGVYVGQGAEMLFLQDTDGDGRADKRKVLLSGFGTGDTHQTINSFIWGPGGELYLGQGDGIESRVETPWGASNLYRSGFYRIRPRRLQLLPFLDDHTAAGNPWGVVFDRWGQLFSCDGAGGIHWLSPGLSPTAQGARLRTIGQDEGYCGIDVLDGRHLPESMQGDFVVNHFKSNTVRRFSVQREGSGFSLEWKEPILQSAHRNFRPVDVRVGPDGAIYVVDWYNPITCHQENLYRDPTRDKAHGRIWRISSTAPALKPPNLAEATIDQLLDALTAPEQWTRYQAKRALTQHDALQVASSLNKWVRSLDPKLPEYEHHLYEALGAYATIEVVEPSLLGRLLEAQQPMARAYATRLVGRWHDRLENPLQLLASRIADQDALVRVEAVVACAETGTQSAIETAARVVDSPRDEWIDFAFKQTVHHLRPMWMPAFQRGELTFARPSHLAAVLNESGGDEVLEGLKNLVDSNSLSSEARSPAIAAILAVGDGKDWLDYGLDESQFKSSSRYDAAAHAKTLSQLIEVARFRKLRPEGDLAGLLGHLLTQSHSQVQACALTLAGIWQVSETKQRVLAAANSDQLPVQVRAAAFGALVDMQEPSCRDVLGAYAQAPHPPALRAAAVRSLVDVDAEAAAHYVADLFARGPKEVQSSDASAVILAFLNRPGAVEALASALQTARLEPAAAKQLVRALFSTGRSDKILFNVLSQSLGARTKTPDFNETYVRQLASDARKQGNANEGSLLFHSLACTSCHKVGGVGGVSAPDLTAIGTTLSAERIVEELLWPNRQIKEGYTVVQVFTDGGIVHQGYERHTKASQASGDVLIQKLDSQETLLIKKENIEETQLAGSPMPAGLTSVLTQSQLLDLIRYLSELGQIK